MNALHFFRVLDKSRHERTLLAPPYQVVIAKSPTLKHGFLLHTNHLIALKTSAGACLEFDMSQFHQILVGDCIDMMRTLPDENVRICINTPSPPFSRIKTASIDLTQTTCGTG
ncbi:hypothetical protein [Pseudomonas syringae]|uniref:Uncharacterized protein n=1 Tax=Pseudomonas syringae TaxID=317 RepID=A0A9Q4A4C6_PSESX|nr:hypothetical protein [Pseudomonas syringae]MCF5470354.1 hypothetical protein [Pseudomonas syringae]MCF5471550.1 hypothetical protein [Pseudomonas syringae]MCF5482155.1 hypothetical protein [Pseudomonas syringae]MCF5489545.1 hypothetical protein [Pseudomonas syringae]MCF5495345.1 hypothetical protein [Pseudomonas syringae]